MRKSWTTALCLTFLIAGTLPADDEKPSGEKSPVKPATVETKKKADTQLFVKTVPEGAKVLVDGKDVGASPHLFEVPPGATKMTVKVELEGYPRDQRTILIQGGRITRVIFDLEDKKGTTAVTPESGVRKVALRFGRALAEADTQTLEEFWKLDDPLDREAADILLSALRKAQWKSSGPSNRVELVHHARIGNDALTACYYADPGLSADGSPTPVFQYFELEEGRWRTQPLPNLRIMAGIEGLEPERMQRRLLVRKLIGLRFGPWTQEKLVANTRANVRTFRALAAPPYEMSQFQKAAESLEKQLAQDEKLAKHPWPRMEEMALSDPDAGDVGSPDDFYLAFYLEAPEGQNVRELPLADGGEAFPAERVPCLTDQDVKEATVDEDSPTSSPQVRVVLTQFGTEVLGRVTREHSGKRMAIVVDGKVVSAPTIRSVIAGGQAVISGVFTHAEVEEMAKQLNAYRQKCRDYLDTMRKHLTGNASTEGEKSGV